MGKWKYGVVLDAGSSGTRAHVYRWLNAEAAREQFSESDKQRLPELETKKDWTKKIHPGISTFGGTPTIVGTDHLASLYEHALDIIPSDEVAETPVFLLATAGMRLLPDQQRADLLQEICRYTKATTKFQVPDCDLHIQVIPGETEGLYGWIAANYLLGGFDFPEEHQHGKGHHTYGFLDMGGASAQIAFAPNATETIKHAEDLTLVRLRTVQGAQREYRVFVTTWLRFGATEARNRYVEALVGHSANSTSMALSDPCLPSGLAVAKDGTVIRPGSPEDEGSKTFLRGTGKFDECLERTKPLLLKDEPCNDPPCLVNGVHVPPIDFDVNHFVGVSEYWHTTYQIFQEQYDESSYDFNTYKKRISDFCSQPWSELSDGVRDHKWGKKVDEEMAVEVCFKASWIINMLHEGIGIPRESSHISDSPPSSPEPESQPATSSNMTKPRSLSRSLPGAASKDRHGFLDPFQAVNKIHDTEVSWTLGKMVLYASSQIAPLDAATLAVGFGSNEPGIPPDFQYASGIEHKHTTVDQPIPDPETIAHQDEALDVPTVSAADALPQNDWADSVLSHPNLRRRGPGFLLFLLILVLVFFMLCGRDRRASLRRKLSVLRASPTRPSSAHRRRRGLASKLLAIVAGATRPADSGGKYERVEDGVLHDVDGAPHPDDFELGAFDDDSSDDGKVGGMLSHGVGLGLGPVHAFDPRVLSVRAEDADLNAGVVSGGRATGQRASSRTGSPTRWRSPAFGKDR